ncbi:phage receptor [Pseudomonas resinovorans]|uniref:NfrA family protein n=1 Tax=Metapseudomonas resinovorans TaxID=53412 RepID=UPI00237F978E|nr:phage receptor [Pseudomonas resinovorans]MDE3739921.1 phage receptor [Pseudomonas resinovorans]
MKPTLTTGLAAMLLAGALVAPLHAADTMTDFQRFRSYPFIDRAYREAGRQNWGEVERLMRHLLGRVPNNVEARQLLVEALAKQHRYAEAEVAAEPLGNSQEGQDSREELRLAWIEQDPPKAEQVERWLTQTDGDRRVRLWQAYSLNLARTHGARSALDWLNQIPIRGDGTVLRLARANWSEQLRDWSTTVDQLQPLADSGQLPAQDWRRLSNAQVQLLDEPGLERLLQQAPSAEAEREVRLAMLDRAVALGRLDMARRWLHSLPQQDQNDPAQRARLWELARQENDSPLVRELGNQLDRPCLETAEWLSRHDPAAAREQLIDCRAEDDPQTWLVLAQRLGASDLMERQTLPEPWDRVRRDSLLALWQEQGQTDLALAWLARQPQTPDVLRQRATLIQARGQDAAAERLWLDYYRRTGDLKALDQASYLSLKAGREAETRQMLEQAFDRHRGRLPAPLLQRLASLYAKSDSPVDLARVEVLAAQVDPATRGQLLGRLAEAGQCDVVRRLVGEAQDAGSLRALGRCAMSQHPGEAVVYYQAALDLGDRSSRQPLAYALDAAGDPAGAWRIWRDIPLNELDSTARLTAARSALAAGDVEAAEHYWQQANAAKADDFALGAAIAQAAGQQRLALDRQRQALTHEPRAEHYYAAAGTAQASGEREQSIAWLADAVRLDPDNPRFGADYGMRLAAADTPEVRRRSIPYLERATRAYPEAYRIGETLAWRYDEIEDSASARRELRRVIDLEQDPVAGDDEYGSLEARRYRQRRAHDVLSRRDNLTLASTWSPAGTATNDSFRQDGSVDERRRSQSQNVQLAMWDRALGDEPIHAGKSLSVYGRALMGGDGRNRYGRSLGAGLGLRFKPIGYQNLNLYSEIYTQSELREEDFSGFSLGQWLNPGEVSDALDDHVRDGRTTTDLLLRATASFFDQNEYRNDWRVDESSWNERSLYLDAAWWTRAGDHQWLSRLQQGKAYKLPVDSPQTLMPYGFLEFSAQDPSNDWRQDWRTGVGLRWQYWYGDDRYNAYRAHVTVRTEYQWALGGNLYEQANGVLVGVEVNF